MTGENNKAKNPDENTASWNPDLFFQETGRDEELGLQDLDGLVDDDEEIVASPETQEDTGDWDPDQFFRESGRSKKEAIPNLDDLDDVDDE